MDLSILVFFGKWQSGWSVTTGPTKGHQAKYISECLVRSIQASGLEEVILWGFGSAHTVATGYHR